MHIANFTDKKPKKQNVTLIEKLSIDSTFFLEKIKKTAIEVIKTVVGLAFNYILLQEDCGICQRFCAKAD